MSKKQESQAWATLRKSLLKFCSENRFLVHINRIESGSTGTGIPDTFIRINGIGCWLEGKQVEKLPVRSATKIFSLNPDQRIWHLNERIRLGNSLVWCRIKNFGWIVGVPKLAEDVTVGMVNNPSCALGKDWAFVKNSEQAALAIYVFMAKRELQIRELQVKFDGNKRVN